MDHDDGEPQSKRRKGMSAKRNGVRSSEEMPPPSLGKKTYAKRGQNARRSKKLNFDAHQYKPEADAEGNSTEHDGEAAKGRRKKTGKMGTKRTSELMEADGSPGQPMMKKLRARLSSSSNGRR